MQREDGEIHGGTTLLRQRGIDGPSISRAMEAVLAFDEHRNQEKRERRNEQPKGNVIHAREGHVGRPDHQRHEPIAEAADHGRHDHEEDHDQPVRGDEDIIHVLAGVDGGARFRAVGHLGKPMKNLDAGLLQLPAYGDREKRTDDARHDGEDKIHRADVLVVGRIGITAPAGRVMLGFAMGGVGMCHF